MMSHYRRDIEFFSLGREDVLPGTEEEATSSSSFASADKTGGAEFDSQGEDENYVSVSIQSPTKKISTRPRKLLITKELLFFGPEELNSVENLKNKLRDSAHVYAEDKRSKNLAATVTQKDITFLETGSYEPINEENSKKNGSPSLATQSKKGSSCVKTTVPEVTPQTQEIQQNLTSTSFNQNDELITKNKIEDENENENENLADKKDEEINIPCPRFEMIEEKDDLSKVEDEVMVLQESKESPEILPSVSTPVKGPESTNSIDQTIPSINVAHVSFLKIEEKDTESDIESKKRNQNRKRRILHHKRDSKLRDLKEVSPDSPSNNTKPHIETPIFKDSFPNDDCFNFYEQKSFPLTEKGEYFNLVTRIYEFLNFPIQHPEKSKQIEANFEQIGRPDKTDFPEFQMPKQYIKHRKINAFDIGMEHDMDSEDENWLENYNKTRITHTEKELSSLDFERIFAILNRCINSKNSKISVNFGANYSIIRNPDEPENKENEPNLIDFDSELAAKLENNEKYPFGTPSLMRFNELNAKFIESNQKIESSFYGIDKTGKNSAKNKKKAGKRRRKGKKNAKTIEKSNELINPMGNYCITSVPFDEIDVFWVRRYWIGKQQRKNERMKEIYWNLENMKSFLTSTEKQLKDLFVNETRKKFLCGDVFSEIKQQILTNKNEKTEISLKGPQIDQENEKKRKISAEDIRFPEEDKENFQLVEGQEEVLGSVEHPKKKRRRVR